MKTKCQGRSGAFAFQCDRKPTIERGGKCYCWQHDPERLTRIARERQAERFAAQERSQAEFDAQYKRNQLIANAGVDNLTEDELKAIAALGGIRAMIVELSGT